MKLAEKILSEISEEYVICKTSDSSEYRFFLKVRRSRNRSYPHMTSFENARKFKTEKEAKEILKLKAFDRPGETFEVQRVSQK